MRVPKNSRKLFESTLIQNNWLTTQELQAIQQENPDIPLEESLLKKGRLTLEQLKIVLKEVRSQMYQGKSFGKYDVLYKIAKGAMGEVYKVRHRDLNKIYALKMVRVSDFSSEEILLRFEQEAQIIAKFDHPHIIQIYDFGQIERKHYFVMEYIQGAQTLEMQIQNGLVWKQGIPLILKSLDALHYAHQHNVLHRDIKPENILVTPEGEPKLSDFGLATEWKKTVDENEKKQITWAGQILGTPAYMSPEQASGEKEVGPSSDIYSMGVCLYQVLTGHCPHDAETIPFLLYKIMTESIKAPSFFQKELPKDLDMITLKALEKNPAERYLTAEAFATDLKRFQQGLPILAKPASPQEKAIKWAKRNFFIFLGIGFLAILTVFSFIGAIGIRLFQQNQQFKSICFQAQEFETLALNATTVEDKIYYFLQEQGQLSLALSLQPGYIAIESKKFENGKILIHLLCKKKSFHLAEYITQELTTLTAIPPSQKLLLQALPQEEQERNIAKQKQEFKHWLNRLSQEYLDSETIEEAVLEISEMRISEVFQQLLFFMEEGTAYFIKNPIPSKRKEIFYGALTRALGRQENQGASLPLYHNLKILIAGIKNNSSKKPSLSQQVYCTILFSAIIHTLEPQTASKLYEDLVLLQGFLLEIFGTESYFVQNTQWVDQKLKMLVPHHKSELINNSRPTIETLKEAYLQIRQGHFQESVVLLDSYLRYFPNDVDAYMLRGYAQDSLKNFEQASENYSKIIQLAPPNIHKVYLNRGLSYRNLEKYSAALADYDEAIRLDPRFFEAYINRGFIKELMDDLEGAQNDYTLALRLNANLPTVYNSRGYIYFLQNKQESALKDYNNAIRIAPQNALFYYNRAELKLTQKLLEEAHQDLSRAFLLEPNAPRNFYLQGEIKTAYKDFDGAIRSYEEALKQEPSLAECILLFAYMGKIQVYLEQEHWTKAQNIFSQSLPFINEIKNFSSNILLQRKISQILTVFIQKNGWNEKSFSQTDRKTLASILSSQGKQFEKQNETENAISTYENAIRLDSESSARTPFLDLLLQRCLRHYRNKSLQEAEIDLLLFQKYAPSNHPEKSRVQKILEAIRQESPK